MIRLILVLLASIYLVFITLGADRGQLRYGLMTAGAAPEVASKAGDPASDDKAEVLAAAVPATVIPATEVAATEMAAPKPIALSDVYVQAPRLIAAANDNAASDAAASASDVEKQLMFIAANGVNVRAGPSKEFAVLDQLPLGEAVTLVSRDAAAEGWSLIRLEGDGIEGYVANALLSDAR